MIPSIVRKEVLESLLSLRFVLSLLLIILLFTTSGFMFVIKHRQTSDDYWTSTNKNLTALSEQSKRLYQLALFKQLVRNKPKALALCSDGFEKYLPNHFRFDVFEMDLPEVKSRKNVMVSRFCDIDWVFIISLILSFVALLLTYDGICGEKETGTLALMLAGSVPRHHILLGKYFGVIFMLGISLLIGLLINLVIVISSNIVIIGALEWLKILTIILLSFLYLSIFVLLGMFVSSRTAHSTNSMVILLLVWVGLVILIPSFGRIISDAARQSPTRAELERRLNEVVKQMVDAAIAGKFGGSVGYYDPDLDNPRNNPPASARYMNAMTNAKSQVLEDHLNRMIAPAIIGRSFTCISPAAIYQRSSETITGTGINRFSFLLRQIKRYQEDLREFIRSKDAGDPDSLHLLIPWENAMEGWRAISHESVSFDTVPKFQEKDTTIGESLRWAIWDIGLLALFNLAFFAVSFVSFLRYDVR